MNMQEFMELWEQFKAIIIALFGGGLGIIGYEVVKNIKMSRKLNKVINFQDTISDVQEKTNKKLLGVVDGIVTDYKDIKKNVSDVVVDMKDFVKETNRKVDTLVELFALVLAMTPSSSEVKLAISKKLDEIKVDLKAKEVLTRHTTRLNDEKDTIDALIDEEE